MQLRIHVDFSSPSVRFYFPSIHSEDFMNYHDFKQQIISTLSDRLGSDVRITVSDILKNNDTHLDGLTILAPGQNLAPTIYLDYYYGQYERGRSFSDITDDILTAYRENPPKSPVDISFFTDYDLSLIHI
mgnify:FL=1